MSAEGGGRVAFRLLKDGQMVHVHRTTKIMPNGKPSNLTRAEVGRAGTVYEDLPEHVVEQILDGEFADDVWEEVEPNPAFDPDADEPGDPWRPVTTASTDDDFAVERENDQPIDEVLRRARRTEQAETRADEAERELEVLRARVTELEAERSNADGDAGPEKDDSTGGHGHEHDEGHEHEPITIAVPGRRLRELVEMHALTVVGTGSQGTVKNGDMLDALLAEHGQK